MIAIAGRASMKGADSQPQQRHYGQQQERREAADDALQHERYLVEGTEGTRRPTHPASAKSESEASRALSRKTFGRSFIRIVR